MTAWRIADGGVETERLALQGVVPAFPTILGALFAPPASGSIAPATAEDGWPPGRYVFRVGGRWFGAEIRLVASRVDRSSPPSLP